MTRASEGFGLDHELTKEILYLTFTGDLGNVLREYFRREENGRVINKFDFFAADSLADKRFLW